MRISKILFLCFLTMSIFNVRAEKISLEAQIQQGISDIEKKIQLYHSSGPNDQINHLKTSRLNLVRALKAYKEFQQKHPRKYEEFQNFHDELLNEDNLNLFFKTKKEKENELVTTKKEVTIENIQAYFQEKFAKTSKEATLGFFTHCRSNAEEYGDRQNDFHLLLFGRQEAECSSLGEINNGEEQYLTATTFGPGLGIQLRSGQIWGCAIGKDSVTETVNVGVSISVAALFGIQSGFAVGENGFCTFLGISGGAGASAGVSVYQFQ